MYRNKWEPAKNHALVVEGIFFRGVGGSGFKQKLLRMLLHRLNKAVQDWRLTCGTPKGPCRYMVQTCYLKGLPYHDFGAYVGTIMVLGPFGTAGICNLS